MKSFIIYLSLFLMSLTSCIELKCDWTEQGACEAYVEAIDTKFNECTGWVYDVDADIEWYCQDMEEKCVKDSKMNDCLDGIENATCEQIFNNGGIFVSACDNLTYGD